MATETSTAEVVRDRGPMPSPSLMDVATSAVGSDQAPAMPDILANPPTPPTDYQSMAQKLAGMVPDAPSQEELRDARFNAQQARETAARNAADFAAVQAPIYDETRKMITAHADEAARRAPGGPPTIPAPPQGGLRPFLSASPNESPESTISKLVQATSLFATMIGGGKIGARASLSALTGALEGWRAGDRERANRAMAQWKAETDRMLTNWKLELTGYESWLKNSGLPIEAMLKGLQLEAAKRGNQTVADAAASGSAEAVLKSLEHAQKVAIDAAGTSAQLSAMYEDSQAKHLDRMTAFRLEYLKYGQLNDQFNQKMAETMRHNLATEGLQAAAIRDRQLERAEGARTPAETLKVLSQIAAAKNELANITALMPQVRLELITGGIQPWLNKIKETGAVQLGPLTLPVNIAGKNWEKLSPAESQFLTKVRNYTDLIVRIRTGQAVPHFEYEKVLGFVPSERLTPENLKTRIADAVQGIDAAEFSVRDIARQGGYKAPAIKLAPPPTQPSSAEVKTVSRSNAAYKNARASGMSDEAIAQKYGLKVVD